MNSADKIAVSILALFALSGVMGFIMLMYGSHQAESAAVSLTYTELPVTTAWIGPNSSTQVVATNTARTYLEIQNVGASTSVPVYCNTNGRAEAAIFSGIVIGPTSSKAWDLDNMYMGALNCRSATASTTLYISER